MSLLNTESDVKPQAKVLSPQSLAHVVFHTADLPRMVSFWTAFLGGTIVHQDKSLAFIRYDDEHHRIAIIEGQGLGPAVTSAVGMHHVAFSFANLKDLARAYEQRKAHGIVPKTCVNHGPTTSMYYSDPDGNFIETQVDNFDTVDEAIAFMESDLFAENPIGTDFEPEELLMKLNNGIDERIIKKRIEIGPRGLADL